MAKLKILLDAPTDIQRVFINSPVNNGVYLGNYLPQRKWNWPTNGFLTRRLAELRKQAALKTKQDGSACDANDIS